LEDVCSRIIYCGRDLVVVESRIRRGAPCTQTQPWLGAGDVLSLAGRLLLGIEGRGERVLGPSDYEVIPRCPAVGRGPRGQPCS